MKRLIGVILLSATICTATTAQIVPWYLKDKKADELILQHGPAKVEVALRAADVCLLMPFTSGEERNIATVDFYSGALLALRDLGNQGFKINLKVFDCSKQHFPAEFAGANVIIGPINRADIENAVTLCPDGAAVVSPLDPDATSNIHSNKIIQVPTSARERSLTLADWFSSSASEGRQLVVLAENETGTDAFSKETLGRLKEKFVHFRVLQDTTLYKSIFKPEDKVSILIASEDELYVRQSIRAVSALCLLKYDIATFCSPKVKSYDNLDVDFFHNCNLHLCSNYYTDYKDSKVRDFVYAYRALFSCEPNQFAFHGYDTMHFFAKLCAEFGPAWIDKINDLHYSGLQTGFAFKDIDLLPGKHNTDVRKIEYCRDFSISVH